MSHKITYFLANGLAAVMDFGVGAFITSFVFYLTGNEVTPLVVLLGGCFALLPDLDAVPTILSFRFVTFDHHVSPFHRPVLLLPIVTSLAFGLGGAVWATAVFLSVVYHYLHDTGWVSTESGIAWFWPVSDRCWAWFGSYEQPEAIPHQTWLDTYWLHPTGRSLSELTIGTVMYVGAVGLFSLAALVFFVLPLLWILPAAYLWWLS